MIILLVELFDLSIEIHKRFSLRNTSIYLYKMAGISFILLRSESISQFSRNTRDKLNNLTTINIADTLRYFNKILENIFL